MRILLIAYDFPPLSSPQAIRWHYLARELVKLGAQVHVLAPDLAMPDGTGLKVPEGVHVHRCDAGGLAGWLSRRRRVRAGEEPASRSSADHAATNSRPISLNWKGHLHHRLEKLIGLFCFPDSRGSWGSSASGALVALIETLHPDVVISSHEPATTLQLGLVVAPRVSAWLADLGDPVLAPYTPRRWRRRARRLEADVCASAAAVSVTTPATRQLLLDRHGADPKRVFVLTQGYDDSLPRCSMGPRAYAGSERLHLLYTGRFYAFRDPTALLEAVVAVSRIKLTVVAPEVRPEHLAIARRSGGRIVFLGEQPHARVLELQQDCDILLNIGNALSAQTPGKLYEYLGSGKPILHCFSVDGDPANALIDEWRRGWSCRNDRAELQAFLEALAESPERMFGTLSTDDSAISAYSWSRLARRLLERCEQAIAERG